MKHIFWCVIAVTIVLASPMGAAAGTRGTKSKVSFGKEILPILISNCLPCHGGDQRIRGEGRFYVTSYSAIMRGSQNGKMIIPKRADMSPLIRLLKANDDSRMPPNPYNALADEKIQLLERWISQGALSDEATPAEHEIQFSPVDPRIKGGVWVSCRTPVSGHVRLQITDPRDERVVDSMCWPAEAGEWVQWVLPYRDAPPVEYAWPSQVKLTLYIDLQSPLLSPHGTVFVVSYGMRPKEKDLQATYGRVAISPDPITPPRHAAATFTYWLDVESDINYQVWSERSDAPKPIYEGAERDMPSGENNVTWKLLRGKNKYPVSGWYTARFRAKSRVPGRKQPDFAILFKVTRMTGSRNGSK